MHTDNETQICLLFVPFSFVLFFSWMNLDVVRDVTCK